jgi:hypothetical protein
MLTNRNKREIQTINMEFFRTNDGKRRRHRHRNQILSKEVGIKHLLIELEEK